MSTIPSVSKWKISTYILAITTAAALYQGRSSSAADGDPQVVKAAARDASYDQRMGGLARLRIPAAMAGVDEKQLLRDLRATGSVPRMILICERLAIFGSDMSLESLLRVSKDHPRAFAAAAMAMGGIGSDAATDQLLEMMEQGLTHEQYNIMQALATTKNPRAQMQIVEWAQGAARPRKLHAIAALGVIGGTDALELLEGLARSQDQDVVRSVLGAAGAIGNEKSVAILQRIAEGENRRLRVEALNQMPSALDEQQRAWLIDMLALPDSRSAAAAADALGRARVGDALPLLVDAARTGSPELQLASIRALSKLGGEQAQLVINELFAKAGQRNAYELGRALLASGPEGRATFLASMKEGHRVRPQLLYLLDSLSGEEIDDVRMHVARTGQPQEKLMVLRQLTSGDNEEAIDIALDLAKSGPRQLRAGSMSILAQSSSPRARDALIEIASGDGPASLEALQVLGNGSLQSDETSSVLIDALHSGNKHKLQAATWALASDGSDAGRAALLAAMQSDDLHLARAATRVASQLGNTPEVTDSLQELASNAADPQVKAAALQQLVAGGSPQAGQLVVDALQRGDSNAEYLISTVLNSGGEGSELVIAEAAKSDKAQTRAALAGALAQRGGDENAMRHLSALTRDEDDSVKSAAVYALANVGSSESVDQLLELAQGGDTSTRNTALSLIGNTGDARASEVIATAIRSGDNEVVQSAINGAINAGPEVESALLTLAEDGDAEMRLREQAVNALEARGVEVSEELQAAVEAADFVDLHGDFGY